MRNFLAKNSFGLIAIISVAFAITRAAGIHNDIFKDFAHCWIGCLFTAGFFYKNEVAKWYFYYLVAVELLMFVYTKTGII